jgi:hypothetical protein
MRATILRHIFPSVLGATDLARGNGGVLVRREPPWDASCYLTATGLRSRRASSIWA